MNIFELFSYFVVVLETSRATYGRRTRQFPYSRLIDGKSFLNRFDMIDAIRHFEIELRFVVGSLLREEMKKPQNVGWQNLGRVIVGGKSCCVGFFLNFLDMWSIDLRYIFHSKYQRKIVTNRNT